MVIHQILYKRLLLWSFIYYYLIQKCNPEVNTPLPSQKTETCICQEIIIWGKDLFKLCQLKMISKISSKLVRNRKN